MYPREIGHAQFHNASMPFIGRTRLAYCFFAMNVAFTLPQRQSVFSTPSPSPPEVDQGVDALHDILTDPLRASNHPDTPRLLRVLRRWATSDVHDPVEDQSVAKTLGDTLGLSHETTCDHLGAFVGPVLLWSIRQTWAPNVHYPRLVSSWCNQHYVRISRTQPHRTCEAALSHLLVWQTKFPVELQKRIAAHALQDVNIKMDWTHRRGHLGATISEQHVQEWNICAGLTRLVASHPQHPCEKSTLLEHWTTGMAEYAASKTFFKQIHWAGMTLDSDLPVEYKLRACALLSPHVWLDDAVQSKINTLLPMPELERFEALPWASARTLALAPLTSLSNGKLNQALLRLYCPVSEGVLDCVATEADWIDKKAIASLMRQLKESTGCVVYNLPDNMELAHEF